MNRNELYTEILSTILTEHSRLVTDIDNIREEFELNGLLRALTSLEGKLQDPKLECIITSMKAKHDEEELVNYEVLDVNRGSFDQVSKKRDFKCNLSNLTVLNCDCFFNEIMYNDATMLAFEKICYVEERRKEFLNYVLNNDGKHEYYVIYDRNVFNGIDSWKLYMYALFMCVNEGGNIESNSSLDYTPSSHYLGILFDPTVKYEQYIDIYDVISEWNTSRDLLNAFLKMYQILEYMVYRKEFVTIVQGANIKQSFVRQIKGLDRKFSNSERDTFIKGVSCVLSSFAGDIPDSLVTASVKDFCLKYYPLSSNGNTYMTAENIRDTSQINNCISKFIYDVRCSLVHNKESEFHITMINYDEYAPIVPLMKEIMKVVGKKIMETLNTPNNNICFPNSQLPLY